MLDQGEFPPVSDRDKFLSEFNTQFQGIKSWKTPLVPEKTLFRNWGDEAIRVLGQKEVPFFDRRTHFSPEYTGFVRHAVFQNEDADFAYIENGEIVFTQKNKSQLSVGVQYYETSWRDGNFRINEAYSGADFPKRDEVLLSSMTKEAEFINENDGIRVMVKQDKDDKFRIRLDEYNEERKRWGYGACGVIEVDLTHQNPGDQTIIAAMQSEPELFSATAKIIPLLTDSQVASGSGVYYGFKDGKYGNEYSATERKIENELQFREAMKIAFPSTVEQYLPN